MIAGLSFSLRALTLTLIMPRTRAKCWGSSGRLMQQLAETIPRLCVDTVAQSWAEPGSRGLRSWTLRPHPELRADGGLAPGRAHLQGLVSAPAADTLEEVVDEVEPAGDTVSDRRSLTAHVEGITGVMIYSPAVFEDKQDVVSERVAVLLQDAAYIVQHLKY